jgi:pentatricopeptide repeat protein
MAAAGAAKLTAAAAASAVFRSNQELTRLARSGQLAAARRLFDSMPRRNTVTYNAMLSALARHGRIDEARALFEGMPSRNAVSWNAMIAALSDHGRVADARSLLVDGDGLLLRARGGARARP